ncbi:MAG: hypothetical protein HRU38_00425 [Saccharospirillaceae bacterium]|nr:hypothetical protein [Colwellia sp.]NRB77127.1 hypothetical protein [Saccharospirillaceae bacterium]
MELHFILRILSIIPFLIFTPSILACSTRLVDVPKEFIELKYTPVSLNGNEVWSVEIIAESKFKNWNAATMYISTFEKPFLKIPVSFWSNYNKVGAKIYLADDILKKSKVYIGYGRVGCTQAQREVQLKPNKPLKQDK